MTRSVQISFVILAAVLCAWLSACASRPATAGVISSIQLERGLKDQLRGATIHLEDNNYQITSDAAMWRAVDKGWLSWRNESWDCDDQASGVMHALRLAYREERFAPAAGRVTGNIRGKPHAALWWLNSDGRFNFLDASDLIPLHPKLIQAWRVTDK